MIAPLMAPVAVVTKVDASALMSEIVNAFIRPSIVVAPAISFGAVPSDWLSIWPVI